jgi:hypothetical protein
MPAQRAFDHDLLRRLVTENPELSDYDLKKILDADNVRHGRTEVNIDTIRSLLSKRRKDWGIPVRRPTYDEIRPPRWAAFKQDGTGSESTPYRYLRDQAAVARGTHRRPEGVSVKMAELRRQSTDWLAWMRRERLVVDLTREGEVIERPAVAGELTPDGGLVSVMAWRVPGWRGAKDIPAGPKVL